MFNKRIDFTLKLLNLNDGDKVQIGLIPSNYLQKLQLIFE